MSQTLHMIENVNGLLHGLRLKGMQAEFQKLAEEKSWDPISYLYELCQREQESKTQKRIQSLLKKAKLPRNKTMTDFDLKRLPELHPGKIGSLGFAVENQIGLNPLVWLRKEYPDIFRKSL